MGPGLDMMVGTNPHCITICQRFSIFAKGVDFGLGGQYLEVVAYASGISYGATIRFQLGSPDTAGQVLGTVVVPSDGSFSLINGAVGGVPTPAGIHSVFMVFTFPPLPPVTPPDDKPHRYWRITAGPADFNTSFYNPLWHVCAMELRENSHATNLATDPTRAIQSSGDYVQYDKFSIFVDKDDYLYSLLIAVS